MAKSMEQVTAKYRQMTAGHNAGYRHMWYRIAIKVWSAINSYLTSLWHWGLGGSTLVYLGGFSRGGYRGGGVSWLLTSRGKFRVSN